MLILSRKATERIQLGDDVTITVVRTSKGSVSLGIDAPANVRIIRSECCNSACSTPQDPQPTWFASDLDS